jgi:hypothetical protein
MGEEPIDEKTEEQPSMKDRVWESLVFVVDMMNSGKVDADKVYPKGHYQGD